MKIAIFLPDMRGGGVEHIRLVLAHEFVLAGYEVEFVLMQAKGELLEATRTSFSVVDLETSRVRNALFALVRYLSSERPDVLLAAMWPLTVIAPIAARLSRQNIKVIVSEHGILSAQYQNSGLLHRAMLRLSAALGYRIANKRIGVSSGLVQDMANLSWMKEQNFDVIYNPLTPRSPPSANAIRAAEDRWGPARGGRILSVGNMKPVKNHQLLLRAFALIDRQDAKLLFLGDGAERDSLSKLADKLDLTERVVFAGFESDPTPYYNTADVFVLSSNYEGFGNVIVEALASGTTIVSTDCPSGPAEILDNGTFGHLVPVGSVEALANTISKALDGPANSVVLKRRAADFAVEIAARKYLDLLDS